MIFKKLKFQNIRSYENFELAFPKGSVLLSGDIGAGKTSILLALQFALFGLQPGQKGSSLLRQGADSASVCLEIEIDGKNIILERGLKKSKSSISQESNIITIDKQAQELSTSEMKNRVIEILNYPKEFVKKSNLLYKFTIYTPQEEMKSIITEKPEIRLDILRHVFGIDRYKTIKENAGIFVQKIKESIKIKEAQTGEINALKEKMTCEIEKRIQLSRQINNLNIEFSSVQKQKQDAEAKLKKTESSIKEKQLIDSQIANKKTELKGKNEISERLIKEILQMRNQIKDKIDFNENNLKETEILVKKHKDYIEELNLTFLKINSKISILESRKENAFQLKDKIISLENCPTCFQSVSLEHKNKLSKRTQFDIEEIERELIPAITEKNRLIADLEKEKSFVNVYEQDIQGLRSNKIKLEHQKEIEIKIKSDSFVLDRNLAEIAELENQIKEWLEKSAHFVELEKAFEDAENSFKEINSKTRILEISLAEKNKELEILLVHIEILSHEIAEKEKIKSQINYLREMQDWIEERFIAIIALTESNVLAKLRSEFSKIFNEWFSILVSDVLLARLDEDFTPVISQQDYELDYDFLSGGERTAVALAYRLALNQVLNSLLSKIKTKDIIILDEPTDGFSAEQLDKMRDIFQQLEAEQIILVSHEQKIEGFVDNIIRIKKDGISLIEQSK